MDRQRLEDGLGAAAALAGALLVAASLLFSTVQLSGCGPCWPGSCPDSSATPTPTSDTSATPTPTPTPTPSPTVDVGCALPRTPGLVDENLWQRDTPDCPRIVLDPEGPRYDDESLCESGVWTGGEDPTFFFRYACNASAPWKLTVAQAGPADSSSMLLEKACPDVVPQTEAFVNGRVREALLWDMNETAIVDAVREWRGECLRAADTSQLYAACLSVCAGDESLYSAMDRMGVLPEDPAVRCYLALYDGVILRGGESLRSTDDGLAVTSQCGCQPTQAYADCLAGEDATGETCFADGDGVEPSCEETCWTDHGSDGADCAQP